MELLSNETILRIFGLACDKDIKYLRNCFILCKHVHSALQKIIGLLSSKYSQRNPKSSVYIAGALSGAELYFARRYISCAKFTLNYTGQLSLLCPNLSTIITVDNSFIYAISHNNITFAEYLRLKAGANINARNYKAIWLAARRGSIKTLDYLLLISGDTSRACADSFALAGAAETGMRKTLCHLIARYGVKYDANNHLAVRTAANADRVNTLNALLRLYPNPEIPAGIAILHAASCGSLRVLMYFYKKWAHLFIANIAGMVHIAEKRGFQLVTEYICSLPEVYGSPHRQLLEYDT